MKIGPCPSLLLLPPSYPYWRRRLCRQADSRIIPTTVKPWSTDTHLLPLGKDMSDRRLRGWSGEDKEHMRNPVKVLRGQEDWCHPSPQGHTLNQQMKAHLLLYEIVSMRWPLLPSCFPFKS